MNDKNNSKEIITKISTDYDEKIHQGDFIRDVNYLESFSESDGQIQVSMIEFPLVVVLTQECDAIQFYDNLYSDKEEKNQYLFSTIVIPVYNIENIKSGKHLEKLELKCREIGREDIRKIKQNKNERYHYMKIEIKGNYVEYVVDFKHYFTVNAEQLVEHKSQKENFQFTLCDLFKESLSQRFSNYLSRIGLPETEVKIS